MSLDIDQEERLAIKDEGCGRAVRRNQIEIPEPDHDLPGGATEKELAALREEIRKAPPRDPWWALGTATDRRTAAAWLARLGLHPIAIHGLTLKGECTCGRNDCGKSAGKHPVMKGWQRGDLDASTLDKLFAANWAWNLGLRMGRQPNGWFLIAVDVDGPRSLIEPIEKEAGQQFPPTLEARTGSGGTHLIYRIDPSRAPSNRVKVAPGVDVRSEGGQIVCAPSRHRSGGSYAWTNLQEPAVLS